MNNDWFVGIDGADIEQGDLFFDCPVIRPTSYTFPLPDEIDVNAEDHDVVVLTQTCDLENDKVLDVLLAKVQLYSDLVKISGSRNPAIKGRNWRASVRKGEQPPYVLVPHGSNSHADWAIVDFHHLFTVPKQYLVGLATQLGTRPRLVSPYKEHLAQAFAGYMMRVGLPNPLADFDTAAPE